MHGPWWAPRPSKPLRGAQNVLGVFDPHASPPGCEAFWRAISPSFVARVRKYASLLVQGNPPRQNASRAFLNRRAISPSSVARVRKYASLLFQATLPRQNASRGFSFRRATCHSLVARVPEYASLLVQGNPPRQNASRASLNRRAISPSLVARVRKYASDFFRNSKPWARRVYIRRSPSRFVMPRASKASSTGMAYLRESPMASLRSAAVDGPCAAMCARAASARRSKTAAS